MGRRDPRCSFCGKAQDQVRKLVAGPGVFICDQCVALCNEVLAQSPPPPVPPVQPRPRWMARMRSALRAPRFHRITRQPS